jgi:hypothetical protein
MRVFKLEGQNWVAAIHDGAEKEGERVGWEVIQFDTQPAGTIQRISYRPAGWLHNASVQELIEALLEGETVRARWRE